MKKQHIDIAKWIGIILVVGGMVWKQAVWQTRVDTRLEGIETQLSRLDPQVGPPSR